MSVLVQRPHQLPGLSSMTIHLPKQPKLPSTPRRQQPAVQVPRQVQSAVQPRSSKRCTPSTPARHGPSPPPTTPSNNPPALNSTSALCTVKSPSNQNQNHLSALSSPALSLNATTTPARQSKPPTTPNNNRSSAARANTQERRRDRARSPPEFPYDEEQLVVSNNRPHPPSPSPGAKRNRRTTPAPAPSPATWQQSLFTNGPASTPNTPYTGFPAHTQTRPKTTTHQRAPSYPTFPSYGMADNNPFFVPASEQAKVHVPLDVLFNSSISLSKSHSQPNTTPLSVPPKQHQHARGVSVSASLPIGIHSHMADREPRQRTLTGGRGFAGASFQHAPDAISSGAPFGALSLGGKMFGGRFGGDLSASSSEEELEGEGVVNLDEDESSEDDGCFF